MRRSSPAERAEIAFEMRQRSFVLVNQAADAAGPMSELDRAVFILRRLYPEFSDDQLAFIRADLSKREVCFCCCLHIPHG